MMIGTYQITRGQMLIFGAILVILILLALVFFGGVGRTPTSSQVTLELWGLFDDQAVWSAIITEYRKSNPKVFVNYTKMNPDTYERDLLEALASGKAPDIIMFHSSWLPKHGNKITPMPAELMTLRQFQEIFPDVATTNFVSGNQIYALPLWMDALAMFYNKDLFNTAKIASPPKTWDEFISAVQKLSAKDRSGNLVKSGAALGTADNVEHSADILSLLMLQIGAKMVSDDGTEATFNREVQIGGQTFSPGESALRFYTDFASPKSAAYAWNERQPNSFDAFISGQTAMIFDYAVNVPRIKERAPNLRLGISAIPQVKGAVKNINYASYWGYTVPQVSKNSLEAWKFIAYLATPDINKYFSTTVGRVGSRRDVISEEMTNPDLGVFADEILSAASWYQADPAEIEKIFKEMISAVTSSGERPADAINDAANKVTFIMKRR